MTEILWCETHRSEKDHDSYGPRETGRCLKSGRTDDECVMVRRLLVDPDEYLLVRKDAPSIVVNHETSASRHHAVNTLMAIPPGRYVLVEAAVRVSGERETP